MMIEPALVTRIEDKRYEYPRDLDEKTNIKGQGQSGETSRSALLRARVPCGQEEPRPPVEISNRQTSGHTDQVSRQVAPAMLTPSAPSPGRHTSPHQHVDIVASHGMPRERL